MIKYASKNLYKYNKYFSNINQKESINYDICIVGGGVAGLSTAIKLKQLGEIKNKNLEICVWEKGSEIGSHVLSGNCFDPSGLELLFPNFITMDTPVIQKVKEDQFHILLNEKNSLKVPNIFLPKSIDNKNNYIISLSDLSKWLGEKAEDLGIDIFTGFSCSDILYENDKVIGVTTKNYGIGKNGEQLENFQSGVDILSKQTILAEGVRGNLSEMLIEKYNLRKDCDPQSYGIGLKEIWKVNDNNEHFKPGLVLHSIGWPIDKNTYSGSFLYTKEKEIHCGLVLGWDYKNPYINPYLEFQKLKTHPLFKKYLIGGECIKYGARAINEGGYYAIPKLAVPGALMVGCSAGFLDIMKIKGSHNAIKSGIIAAESIYEKLDKDDKIDSEIKEYDENMKNSEIFKDLYKSRNFKGGFKKGIYHGLLNGFLINLTKGKEFYSLRNNKIDSKYTEKTKNHKEIKYPKPDNILTFDLLTNLQRSGTYHEDNQESHLKIKAGFENSSQDSLLNYGGIEEKFCPAKVYEFIDDENGNKKLKINAQNCLHCKTCSIKMIDNYIDWNVPQGGEGPEYNGM